MNIAIYNVVSGEIRGFISCPEALIVDQLRENEEFYLNCPKDATHIIGNTPIVREVAVADFLRLLEIRFKRDQYLAASDWTQAGDAALTVEQKAAWVIYRQQLRDFPATCDPNNPVWPTQPYC